MDLTPFRLTGPTVLSFSGGRTSGMMLRLTLDAHDGQLPPDCAVAFCNVGKEREETLRFVDECSRRWSVPIHWLEYRGRGEPVAEVTFAAASRNGEPLATIFREKHYLANAVTRICTAFGKVLTVRDWMLARGYDAWTNVVGLRADEPDRVAKLASRNANDSQEWTSTWPLHVAGITKPDVLRWWRSQPFDLDLAPHQSNCDACFMRPRAQRERLAREEPHRLAWWIALEKEFGARFVKDEPGGWSGVLDRVQRTPHLPVLLDPPEADQSIACGCTDRAVARARPMRAPVVPCTCGAFAGEGHALRCARVFSGEVAA